MTDTTTTPSDRIQFTARLEKRLHERLESAADRSDRSFNAELNRAVDRYLSETITLENADPDLVQLAWHPETEQVADLIVDSLKVPYLTVTSVVDGSVTTGTEPVAGWLLDLDRRFSVQAHSWDELWRWVWFIANAMAVSAGYTCHGPNASRINRHGLSESIEGSGSSKRTYRLVETFRLPDTDDGSQRCCELQDSIVRIITAGGGRDVETSLKIWDW